MSRFSWDAGEFGLHELEMKNYPAAWALQYAGRSRVLIIILEAVADYDMWI